MDEKATVEIITPADGCGFRLYCGFDDWFIIQGGLFLLLVIGAILVKRWRDLPLVALVAITGPIAAAHLLGAPAFPLERPSWTDIAQFTLLIAVLTAMAAVVHGLMRLALYLMRREPARV
jgi:hypothetical protein